MSGDLPPATRRFLAPANALTALRLLLAPVSAMALYEQALGTAAALFTLAALSDFFDGRVARSRNEASATGALFDHTTDAIYVTAILTTAALLGQVPWLLPLLIPLAFLQYLLDSRALAGKRLRANALGRWNGILYFVLAGLAISLPLLSALQPALAPASILMPLGALLCLSTVASMADRAYHRKKLR